MKNLIVEERHLPRVYYDELKEFKAVLTDDENLYQKTDSNTFQWNKNDLFLLIFDSKTETSKKG